MKHILSFPGLGIGEFEINSVAFSLFGKKDIAWYGIIIVFGMVLAVMYAMYRAKKNEDIKVDDMLDYTIWTVVFGIIGARAYYVIMYTSTNGPFDNFWEIFMIWNGGLAIYGGIIAGIATVIVVSLIKKINILKVLDAVSPGVMIAQAIGRWGNFFNAEAYGYETDLPWRMGIKSFIGTKYYHPTFLYESLWNVLGFVIINFFYNKKKCNGHIFAFYLIWYGVGRFFIEGLRTDSLYIGTTGIRVSQVVAILASIIGIAIIVITLVNKKKSIKVGE